MGIGLSPAALMANLLPYANASLQHQMVGAYVGDGLPPVPPKLAAKIRRWEFIEMGELLPEFWASKDEEGDKRDSRPRRSRKVTDIFTWLQCYATYVAVLAQHEPSAVPELMAYMTLRSSQDFEGLAWMRYDSSFRRQAALTCNKRWSTINSTLYTMNFSGRMSGSKRCELCFGTSHTERECAQSGDPDPDMRNRVKTIESAILAFVKPGHNPRPTSAQAHPSGEACRKWNGGGCTYPKCRHLHVCSECRGGHPVTRCSIRLSAGGPSQARQGPSFPSQRPY